MARENAIADVGERTPGFHVAQRVAPPDEVVEASEDVVAADEADAELAAEAELAGDIQDRLGAAARDSRRRRST